jgi:hypothetical protein
MDESKEDLLLVSPKLSIKIIDYIFNENRFKTLVVRLVLSH